MPSAYTRSGRERRVGVGLRLRVFGRVVDLGLDVGGEARFDLVGQHAGVAELLTEPWEGIVTALGGELLLGAVLRLLVIR